jgi:hypothetical protein
VSFASSIGHLKFYNGVFIGIYDAGVSVAAFTDFVQIVEVDVTVNQKTGFEPAHEEEEGFKAPMATILPVMDLEGRRVGEQDVNPTSAKYPVEDQSRQ